MLSDPDTGFCAFHASPCKLSWPHQLFLFKMRLDEDYNTDDATPKPFHVAILRMFCLPRLIAVPSIYALGIYSLPLGLTSLVVASLALLSVLLPPRRALMRAAYMYFDHVTMDPDSE